MAGVFLATRLSFVSTFNTLVIDTSPVLVLLVAYLFGATVLVGEATVLACILVAEQGRALASILIAVPWAAVLALLATITLAAIARRCAREGRDANCGTEAVTSTLSA